MISGIHVEVILAAGYAVFLAGVAFLLEALARHSHRRAEHYRNSGFTYQRKMDLWECPGGSQLVRVETNYQLRVVKYQAPAHHCNACSLKVNCTDSDDGRQLESRLDTWVESELRRFHRGLSLALLLLAAIILVAESVHHAEPRDMRDLALLAALLVTVGVAGTKLLTSFLARERG